MAVELAPSNVVIEQIDINLLQPHPRNVEIYGNEDVMDLQQSIAESGWIKPLTVNPEYVVISGQSAITHIASFCLLGRRMLLCRAPMVTVSKKHWTTANR
jgi:ParB-like nuclease family protein